MVYSDTLDLVKDESRQVLNKQVDYMIETDKEAFKLLRINLAAVGLVISAFALSRSNSIELEPFLNIYALIGIIALLAALSYSAVTYLRTKVSAGLGKDDINDVIYDLEDEAQRKIIEEHSEYISKNNEDLLTNKNYLQIARFFVLLQIIFIILAVIDGILGNIRGRTIFGKGGLNPVYPIASIYISLKLVQHLEIYELIQKYSKDRDNALAVIFRVLEVIIATLKVSVNHLKNGRQNDSRWSNDIRKLHQGN